MPNNEVKLPSPPPGYNILYKKPLTKEEKVGNDGLRSTEVTFGTMGAVFTADYIAKIITEGSREYLSGEDTYTECGDLKLNVLKSVNSHFLTYKIEELKREAYFDLDCICNMDAIYKLFVKEEGSQVCAAATSFLGAYCLCLPK